MNESATPLNRPLDRHGAPLLGGGAGTYRERPVAPALRAHFARVWQHAVPRDAPSRSAIIPDGCADLVWCNGSLRLAGPDRQVSLETVLPGTTVVGLQFQPGAASRWLGTSASEFVDARMSLDHFWGAEARHLTLAIGEPDDPEELAQRLEIALIHRLPKVASVDELSRAIFRSVDSRRDHSMTLVRQLGVEFAISERTLRRHCYDAFGYGPKTLDRILRFQRFLRRARVDAIDRTSMLATEAGYADQSHLTREARALAGSTPRSIRQQLTA